MLEVKGIRLPTSGRELGDKDMQISDPGLPLTDAAGIRPPRGTSLSGTNCYNRGNLAQQHQQMCMATTTLLIVGWKKESFHESEDDPRLCHFGG